MKISEWTKHSGTLSFLGYYVFFTSVFGVISNLLKLDDICDIFFVLIPFLCLLLAVFTRDRIREPVYASHQFRSSYLRKLYNKNLVLKEKIIFKSLDEKEFISLSREIRSENEILDLIMLGVILEESGDIKLPDCFKDQKDKNPNLYLACYYATKPF